LTRAYERRQLPQEKVLNAFEGGLCRKGIFWNMSYLAKGQKCIRKCMKLYPTKGRLRSQ